LLNLRVVISIPLLNLRVVISIPLLNLRVVISIPLLNPSTNSLIRQTLPPHKLHTHPITWIGEAVAAPSYCNDSQPLLVQQASAHYPAFASGKLDCEVGDERWWHLVYRKR